MKTFLKFNLVLVGLAFAVTSSVWAGEESAPVTAPASPAVTGPQEPISTSQLTAVPTAEYRLINRSADLRIGSVGKVAVIPSAATKADQLTTLTEDIGIMCRIFDKKLAQEHLIPADSDEMTRIHLRYNPDPWRNLTSLLGTADSHITKGIYIEGYGTLFLMNVVFPLSAPPQIEQDKPPQEQADTVWTEAKREMYEPPRADTASTLVKTIIVKYDPKKVEQLNKTLTKSLVHVANIRDLKPTDWVTVMVRGSAPAPNVLLQTTETRSSKFSTIVPRTGSSTSTARTPSRPTSAGRRIERFAPPATVLTIRARKSDIDNLSQKKIDDKEFQKCIQTMTY